MTAAEKEELAELIAIKFAGKQLLTCHAFTSEETQAVKDIVNMKKKAVRTTAWFFGILLLWVIKDLYLYVASHVSFNWMGR